MFYRSCHQSSPYCMARSKHAFVHFLCIIVTAPLFGSSHGLTVGVYEHRPAPRSPKEPPLQTMKKNLAVYRDAVEEAALLNVDLIVFPEYGLHVSAPYSSRDSLLPFLQTIPAHWPPCQSTEQTSDSQILPQLSCMAALYQMTLVVNVGTVHYCNATIDSKCPPDERYQYNTNVVFNKTGHLIATYFKYNLFGEVNFNQPPLQHVTFEEESTKFGLSVCFDLLFKEPVVDLVERHGVQVVILPSLWFNRIPFLAMYEIAEAWAVRMGVYLLVAGTHMPEFAHTGSGVFGPKGVVSYSYVPEYNSGGKLVVAEIPTMMEMKPEKVINKSDDNRMDATISEKTFTGKTNGDLFIYAKIKSGLHRSASVCQGSFCCHLDYSLMETNSTNGFFALGAFSGMHTKNYTLCNEVCAVVRCKFLTLPNNYSDVVCGDKISEGVLGFSQMSLKGSFSNGIYQFPTVLEDDARLMSNGDWSFDATEGLLRLIVNNRKVLAFSIYGRCYNIDAKITRESRFGDNSN